MEQWKAMEYGSRKASPDVFKPRSTYFQNILIADNHHQRVVFRIHNLDSKFLGTY